eukprot:scaffold1146_cov399-Prasinococcus_capsulatus_cf.AAC.69
MRSSGLPRRPADDIRQRSPHESTPALKQRPNRLEGSSPRVRVSLRRSEPRAPRLLRPPVPAPTPSTPPRRAAPHRGDRRREEVD